MRKLGYILRGILPIALSGSLLAGLAYLTDFNAVYQHLRGIAPWSLLAGTSMFILSVLVSSWRYRLVIDDLNARKQPLWRTTAVNLVSLFLTYIMPVAVLADVARVGASCRLLQLQIGEAATAVLHDRILAVAGFVLSAGLVLPLLILERSRVEVVLATTALIVGLLAALLAGRTLLAHRLNFNRVVGRMLSAFSGFFSHFSSAARIARQGGCALLGSLAFTMQLYILSIGLGIALPLEVALAYAPLIALSQIVPFVYGGYGARETAMVALLGGTWLSPDAAISLGLAVGLTNMFASLPGAVLAGAIFNGRSDKQAVGSVRA
jgi:hypothetical protein